MAVRYRFLDAEFDVARRLLRVGDHEHELTPRFFALLELFVSSEGRVLTKEEILDAVWPDSFVLENNVERAVASFRRMMGTGKGDTKVVVTVPGVGYRFVPRCERIVTESVQEPGPGHAPSSDVGRRRSGRLAVRWALAAMFVAAPLLILWLAAGRWSDGPTREFVPYEGVVRKLGTDEAVPGVVITLRGVFETERGFGQYLDRVFSARTDESGRFALDSSTPEGWYGVTLDGQDLKPGGSQLPVTSQDLVLARPSAGFGDPWIRVLESGKLEPGIIEMVAAQPSSELVPVSGIVLDSGGEPVGSGVLRVYDRQPPPVDLADPVWLRYRAESRMHRKSRIELNVSGRFSVDLEPGEYYLHVTPFDADSVRRGETTATGEARPLPAAMPFFYPGVFLAEEAEPVVVQEGTALANVVIPMPPRDASYQITLRLDPPAPPEFRPPPAFFAGRGAPAIDPDYRLPTQRVGIDALSGYLLGGARALDSSENHLFELLENGSYKSIPLPPGEYAVLAWASDRDRARHNRLVEVLIRDRDVNLGTLDFGVSFSIHGTVNRLGLNGRDGVNVVLQPYLDDNVGHAIAAPIRSGGTFLLEDVTEGFYQMTVAGLPAQAYLKSATYDGQDILGVPQLLTTAGDGKIEVVVESGFVVEGVVRTSDGEIQPWARAFLISEKTVPNDRPHLWLADANSEGTFTIEHLPPGKYRVFAYAYDQSGYPDPKFLEEIETELDSVELRNMDVDYFIETTAWDR